jgi:hypothetical protein
MENDRFKNRTVKDMLIDSIEDKKRVIEYVSGYSYRDEDMNEYIITNCREVILDKYKSILATLEDHLKYLEENDKA